MQSNFKSKVAVIGAGIIGVCIAHFLRKNEHEVILYDQNEPGLKHLLEAQDFLQIVNVLLLTHLSCGRICQVCYSAKMVR